MNQKVKERPEGPQAVNACPHHWLIESARGAASRGVCRYCGEEREFYNSWTDFNAMKRGAGSVGIAELMEAESESEQKEIKQEKTHAGV